MPSASFVTPDVNLLPEDALEQKSGGKFLKWALSWGKKIVILTELLVVIAFLSRFKLDSDVANLSEEIDRRKTIIQASANFEKEFLLVQKKIDNVKLISETPTAVSIYDKVQNLIPADVTIVRINISDRHISLDGNGEDQSLSQMVAAFKASNDFADVSLDKVLKQGQNIRIDFQLTAVYAKKT